MSQNRASSKHSWRTAWRRLFAGSTLEAQLYPPLKRNVSFRLYEPRDLDTCLAIYRKNEPGRFPENAELRFRIYLEKDEKMLIVAECDSRIVGCGGVFLAGKGVITLCYGIIDPEFQRQRIGSMLTLLRIAQVSSGPTGVFAVIFAVDASMPIYARFGFVEVGKWKSEDGKDYPIGTQYVTRLSLQRIKSTLEQRGVRVQGEVALHRNVDFNCEIERGATGALILNFKSARNRPMRQQRPDSNEAEARSGCKCAWERPARKHRMSSP